MKEKRMTLSPEPEEPITAVLSLPAGEMSPGTGVVVGHGAANDMNHPLLKTFARELARRGIPCLRFNFLYREKGRSSVDPPKRLIRAFQAAVAGLKSETKVRNVVVAGKSLGARMAATGTADGELLPSGLIFLGYPLHAPGKKEVLRDAPLREIRVPMLFFEGTRDPFCNLVQFQRVYESITAPKTLSIIQDGDHGFETPGKDPDTTSSVYAGMSKTAADWIRSSLEYT